jgi:hypothetical protein
LRGQIDANFGRDSTSIPHSLCFIDFIVVDDLHQRGDGERKKEEVRAP